MVIIEQENRARKGDGRCWGRVYFSIGTPIREGLFEEMTFKHPDYLQFKRLRRRDKESWVHLGEWGQSDPGKGKDQYKGPAEVGVPEPGRFGNQPGARCGWKEMNQEGGGRGS